MDCAFSTLALFVGGEEGAFFLFKKGGEVAIKNWGYNKKKFFFFERCMYLNGAHTVFNNRIARALAVPYKRNGLFTVKRGYLKKINQIQIISFRDFQIKKRKYKDVHKKKERN